MTKAKTCSMLREYVITDLIELGIMYNEDDICSECPHLSYDSDVGYYECDMRETPGSEGCIAPESDINADAESIVDDFIDNIRRFIHA